MRRISVSQSLIAVLLVLAMVASVTGLLGASGPSVKLSTPKAGATVSGVLDVTAVVRGAPRVAYVILGVDEERPFSGNAAPFAFQIDTTALSDGAHRLFAEAYDTSGMIASSKVITIYVKNGPAPMQQVRKRTATQVAKAPGAKASRTAPATRIAANTRQSAVTATAPEAAAGSTAAPIQIARGPLPEPNRTIPETRTAAAVPSQPQTGSRASFASAAVADSPQVETRIASGVRGHTLMINGVPAGFSVAPYIESDRLHAGFRGLFQMAGAKVTWHASARTARSVKGSRTVEVVSGSHIARVNGLPVEMQGKATIREARVMIPLRFFADLTGAVLNWDSGTRVAHLDTKTRMTAERPSDN